MHTFSGELLFQSGYFFKRTVFPLAVPGSEELFFTTYFSRKFTISQLQFRSIATLSIYQLVKAGSITFMYNKSAVVLSYKFNISQSRIIDKVYLVCRLHKMQWNSYLLRKLIFQSLYFDTYYFKIAILFRKRYFFRKCYILEQLTSCRVHR